MAILLKFSTFFSCDIAYIAEELKNRRRLRQFLINDEIPEANEIYRFPSEFDPEQFVEMKPLEFLLYPGSPNDSKLFDDIVSEIWHTASDFFKAEFLTGKSSKQCYTKT